MGEQREILLVLLRPRLPGREGRKQGCAAIRNGGFRAPLPGPFSPQSHLCLPLSPMEAGGEGTTLMWLRPWMT